MKVSRYSKNEPKQGEATVEVFSYLCDDDDKDADVIDFQTNVAVEADNGQPEKPVPSSKKRRVLCFGGIALALILVVALGSYGIANKKQSTAALSTSSTSTTTSHFCQPAGIKDTKEPYLELTLFAGSNRLVNEEEAKFLESAVMEGYNEASGGCTDEYERWTYGTCRRR